MATNKPTNRVKLTTGRVRDFAPRPGQQQSFLWDTETPWLAVRATRGSKAYIFQGRLGEKTPRIRIGDVGAWDIDQARAEARRLQTLIDQGIDPREAKAVAVEAARLEAERKQSEVRAQAAATERRAVTLAAA